MLHLLIREIAIHEDISESRCSIKVVIHFSFVGF